MRAVPDLSTLDVPPGRTGSIQLTVTNTGDVIDGVTARIVGFPERQVEVRPQVLALFPEQAGTQTLTLSVPIDFPAGRHPLTVELHSRQPGEPSAYVDIELVVPAVPAVALHAVPDVVRARRTARFVVTATNRGNVPLDLSLAAADGDRALTTVVEPARLTLPAGTAQDTLVTVRAPRVLLGSDIERAVTITAAAVPDRVPTGRIAALVPVGPPSVDPELDEDLTGEPLTQTHRITLRHRALLTRGSLTAVILLLVIGLWAAAFLFGIGQVFSAEPATKQASELMFFHTKTVATQPSAAAQASDLSGATAGVAGTADGAAAAGSAGTAGAAAAIAVPPGAVPKGGAAPPGVGGTVAGRVVAASDGEPVGRILVVAQRVDAQGVRREAGSAATQADGSYQISGLFPENYVLRFSANGFQTQFGTGSVAVSAAAVTAAPEVVIVGDPAAISGVIDPGDTLDPLVATVRLSPMTGPLSGQVLQEVAADAAGNYAFAGVPAPGEYRLSFLAEGYAPTEVRTSVTGGAGRFQPAVILGAGNGSITGLVVDEAGTSLGGVTVTTTVAGAPVETGTPTTGAVGQFVLGDLPTPATYVLTVAADGFGTTTVVVDLGPGQVVPDLQVSLISGSGTVTGRIVDAAGAGLGGVTVTVGGATEPPTTTTLTEGDVGAFRLEGLPSPGTYTLTFTLAGYLETTVPVVLGDEALQPIAATMARAVGAISGRITDPTGVPLVGVAVAATDGVTPRQVTSTAASGPVPQGGFVIDALPAGRYTVTATAADGTSRTQLVSVAAGATTAVDFTISGAG